MTEMIMARGYGGVVLREWVWDLGIQGGWVAGERVVRGF